MKDRISEIHKHKVNLGYVKSDENPADIGSRGETVSKLMHNELWWKGPKWLPHPNDKWPTFTYPLTQDIHGDIHKEEKESKPI